MNCTEIEGSLQIIENSAKDPIYDLTPLIGLKLVGSSLTIYSRCLKSLKGLEGLKSIGKIGPFGFVGINGPKLEDISALSNLRVVTGSINIIRCDNLKRISTAFAEIEAIATNPFTAQIASIYVLNIRDNALLDNIKGFAYIEYIEGGLRIFNNATLLNLNDLASLQKIGEDIMIFDNASLEQVDALYRIKEISNNLFCFNNPSLYRCCGIFDLLCHNPPQCYGPNVGGSILMVVDNDAGCTVEEIIANGPCY